MRGPNWRRVALTRRVGAAALALLALALALTPDSGDDGTAVLVAASDLDAGTPLNPGHVTTTRFPSALVPAGALRSDAAVDGRILAGPVRAGEPLTDVRLVSTELAARVTGDPRAVAVPVRLADPGVAALLTPGSQVDVITADAESGHGTVVAAGATVLTVLSADPSPAPTRSGRLVLLALPRADAARVAAASLAEEVAVTFT